MLHKKNKLVYIFFTIFFLFFLLLNITYALEKNFGYNFTDNSINADVKTKEAELRFYQKSPVSKTSIGSSLYFLNNEKTEKALEKADKILEQRSKQKQIENKPKKTIAPSQEKKISKPKVFLPPLSKVIDTKQLIETEKIDIEKIEPVPEYKTSISDKILNEQENTPLLDTSSNKQKIEQTQKAKQTLSNFQIFKKYFLIFIIMLLVSAAIYLLIMYWKNSVKEKEEISKNEYFDMKQRAEDFYTQMFKKKAEELSDSKELEELIKENYNTSSSSVEPISKKIKQEEKIEESLKADTIEPEPILDSNYFKEKLKALEDNDSFSSQKQITKTQTLDKIDDSKYLDKLHYKIINLSKKGYTPDQISSILKISIPEVELTLSIFRQKIS